MTNRTRELFDFAQAEPMAVDDMVHQLRDMDEEEIDHVEHVVDNIKTAVATIDRSFEEVEN